MAVLTSKLIVSLVDQISGPARGAAAALRGLSGHASKTTSAIMGAGGNYSAGALARNLLAIGAGYVGVREGIGGTVGAAMKFEEAFADVRKVVDGTPAQLSVLKNEILEMSKVIPTSAEGIAEIVAAAGQSNIPYQELGKFTEMVAKVAVAWDVSERETSESLAKIKTQLNMNTDEIGLYADAINHLSNNTAATAPNLVDFAKRVAAQGDMFGFTATQSLAFGGAMIAAGGETEVAATSFRNMGMALADAANAPKRTQAAFKAIGVNSQKISKAFNKDSVGTMLDVFERINKLPEHERLSAAIGVFGREARALMPLINDTRELRRQLGLVGKEADYSGSAFQEFVIRADTTANVLDLLGNKFRARGIKYGESWLPTLKQFSLGVSDVIDTLDKRVGVIDNIQMAVSGLMSGFGYGGTGGMREMINDLGDLLFGKAFDGDGTQVDQRMTDLAKLSNNFRKIGLDLKAFATDIGVGNVSGAMHNLGEAISKMSGSATVISAIGIAATGAAMITMGRGIARLALSPFGRIGLIAGTAITLIDAVKGANSIGEFADNLAKLSMVEWAMIAGGLVSVAGPLLSLRNLIAGGAAATAATTAAGAGGGAAAASGSAGAGAGMLSRILGAGGGTGGMVARGGLWGLIAYGFYKGLEAKGPSDPRYIEPEFFVQKSNENKFIDTVNGDNTEQRKGAERALPAAPLPNQPTQTVTQPFSLGAIWDALTAPSPTAGIGKPDGPSDVLLVGTPAVAVATPVETRPSGVQDVRLTNPPERPSITNHITVHMTSNASPDATARAIADKVAAASNGAYSDGGM
ncbi:phage tail tape measure protein [Ochrobactrum chromiisoli]|uniref:Phage tail tape measure protein n=1 Tax=Ochrobactrum chromiisoli TaxID=2993941 RepID=A0ABT3QLB0_9HYPH|nr:phage tail tape measure protein [Ochrobactrum chromiisoli]MCX2696401.1 phage tail tape measure protein [Ochrobactrum chromiisoli]